MRIDELERIAAENDYECTKTPGYYKFRRKGRGNYIIYKNGNIKEMWGAFPSVLDDKDDRMKKAVFEFGETFI